MTLTSTGTLPGGFISGTTYYVVSVTGASGTPLESGNPTAYTVQLSATPSGAPITATSTGNGMFTYQVSGTTVTGSGTSWGQNMAGQWMRITPSSTDATNGDGTWYQIQAVNSATSLTLFNEYQGTGTTSTITGASYVIGQVPIINEFYQDAALYYMAMIYYTTRMPDETRAKWFQKMYDDKFAQLNKEFGGKTSSPVLLDADVAIYNPNLFVMNQQQI